jgi:hypothetical protein
MPWMPAAFKIVAIALVSAVSFPSAGRAQASTIERIETRGCRSHPLDEIRTRVKSKAGDL